MATCFIRDLSRRTYPLRNIHRKDVESHDSSKWTNRGKSSSPKDCLSLQIWQNYELWRSHGSSKLTNSHLSAIQNGSPNQLQMDKLET